MKWWQVGLVGVYLGLVAARAIMSIPTHQIHIDEHEWVRRGAIVYESLIEQPTNISFWTDYYSVDMPKLTQYLYGLWLSLWYGYPPSSRMVDLGFNEYGNSIDAEIDYYGSNYWWMSYAQGCSALDTQYLHACQIMNNVRYLELIFGLLWLGAIFNIVYRLAGFWPALASIVFVSIQPLFSEFMITAKLEMLPHALVWIGLGLFMNQQFSSNIWKLVTLGLVAGLAGAAKLDGLRLLIFILMAYLTAVTLFLLGRNWKYVFLRLRQISFITIFTLATVSLLDPLIWLKQMSGFAIYFQHRVETIAYHVISTPTLVMPEIYDRMVWLWEAMALSVVPNYLLGSIILATSFLTLLGVVVKTKRLELGLYVAWVVFSFGLMTSYLRLSYYWYSLPIIPIAIIVRVDLCLLGLICIMHEYETVVLCEFVAEAGI
jgi:hypothetical protein